MVVYDNLVEDLPRGQALSVVAHELAHARHQDVLTGSLLGAAGALCGVGLLGLVVGIRRGPAMSDPVVVPLVLALVALAGFVSTPVQNTVSRQIETRADVDAIRAAGDPERVRADAEGAGAPVLQRPDAAGVGPALVRQPSDDDAADRARRSTCPRNEKRPWPRTCLSAATVVSPQTPVSPG